MQPHLEKPTIDDIEEIHALMRDTWLATYPNEALGITKELIKTLFTPEAFKERRLRQAEYFLNPTENEFYFVAKVDTEIAGVCRGIQHEDHAHLRSLYVLPKYQGEGIGTMLWNAFCAWSKPLVPIRVHVATYNQNAIDFYKSRGCVDTGKRFTEARHTFKNGATIPEMELIFESSKPA